MQQKETREQYAARRERIARERQRQLGIWADLHTSGELGKHDPQHVLIDARLRLAAEGDYGDASQIHEILRLRRVVTRQAKEIARLRAAVNAVQVAAATGETSRVEYVERPPREVVLARRLERKRARGERKARRQVA